MIWQSLDSFVAKGLWKGKQLVPSAWVEAATSFQIQAMRPENPTPRRIQRLGAGATATSFGEVDAIPTGQMDWVDQFIIVLPEKDAVVVLTAAANTQKKNWIWFGNIWYLPCMTKHFQENKQALSGLNNRIEGLSAPRPVQMAPDMAKKFR